MAKSGGNIAAQVDALVRPIVEKMGLRLWDVRWEKEGPDWFLKVLIDRDEPMDTDTCEAATRAINPVLDAADPIPHSYCLEVGSPGLGRRLTRPEHFDAVLGQKVMAHLIRPGAGGVREPAGILAQAGSESVALETQDGTLHIAKKEAAWFKLCDDEALFG